MSGFEEAPPDPDRLRPWSPPASPAFAAQGREPILNLPAAPALLTAATLAAFALQSATGVEAGARRFGFMPAALSWGPGWSRAVTVLFVHGSWGHVLVNALGLLAFGAPVARLLGRSAAGAAVFFLFYAACGVIAALGYAAVHRGEAVLMVGASGAVSGLMGAASRLIGLPSSGPRPRLAPFLSRPVIGMAGGWLLVNLLIAVSGVAPGVAGGPVAWEAHLLGYAAGLALIAPAARALGRTGRSGPKREHG